ncbi:chemotaxis protein CheB [Clostridiaceae bacterium HSG29]|nr:chemotaxis protein CheB [Clostridiaceae bacterium HSG29]
MKYKAVVIGGSAGSLKAIIKILKEINNEIVIPIVILFHLSEDNENELPLLLSKYINNIIKEAEDKEQIQENVIYTAPAMYHLQIEDNLKFSLLYSEKVNYSRPSIDILFETAAEAFNGNLLGILLTGANTDGAKGLKRIEDLGGHVIVQEPSTAYSAIMPEGAIKILKNPEVISLEEIGKNLNELMGIRE